VLKKLERRGKKALAGLCSLFVRTRTIAPEEIRYDEVARLLVIRQHNQMGDMLLAVPAFRGLRRRFPRARISLLAASINTDVMRNNPYIDEVLTYAKERHNRRPTRLIRFLVQLRRSRFDAVIVLNTVSFSITSMLLAWVSGAPIRIGSTSRPFGHDLTRRFYHIELPLPASDELESMHESEHNLYPLSVLGVHERDLRSVLVPSVEERRACDRFIAAAVPQDRRFIVIHPGAGKKSNIWPPDRFAAVAALISDRRACRSIVVRGPVDGAVGARCVAVFGPTDPGRWKPAGDRVVAVRARDGRVASVTVDEVFKVAREMLDGSSGD
jgi:ADP-heptose:LPS heptosyltransferase